MTAEENPPSVIDKHLLLEEDIRLLRQLRHEKPSRAKSPGPMSLAQRTADALTSYIGSWRFLILQSTLLGLWIILNLVGWMRAWDPYPFILLNLILSFQAAFTAPIIMMSQNRQSEIDRRNAEHDYRVNVKAELEIELLHQKIDHLREREIAELIGIIRELERKIQP